MLTPVDLFMSSPGDCDPERQAISQAVQHWNQAAGSMCDTVIRTIDGANLYPGIARYGQEVVNDQLPDYDIHVGVWKDKFGTPTPVAGSGSLEELCKALSRYDTERRPWIMCYFKRESSTDFSDVKLQLREAGCFYQAFSSTTEFGTLFQGHLASYMKKGFRSRGQSTTEADSLNRTQVVVTLLVDERGHQALRTFDRPAIALGRDREKNDLLLSSRRVHREQGIFVIHDQQVLYVDLGGDSKITYSRGGSPEPIVDANVVLEIGDGVVLPDGSVITLKALV